MTWAGAEAGLSAAMIAYSHGTHSIITAEGVETEAELRTLQSLGVDKAQGFYLGKPMGLPELQRLTGREQGSGSRDQAA